MLISLLFSSPIEFVIVIAALVVSLTIHEFSHAYIADKLGDPTPRIQGRVTLNPLAHLDPIGSLALLFIGLGWGKPVIFDPYNLKNPRKDTAIISLAGPASNLILAALLSLLLHILALPSDALLTGVIITVVSINVGLAIFNLIPIHPLDGGKILIGLAPRDVAREWDELLHQYGFIILMFLILPIYNGGSAIEALLSPIVSRILLFILGSYY